MAVKKPEQMTTAEHEQLLHLECDTIRHAWVIVPSDWTPLFGTPFTLRCERCGSERHDTINTRGEVAARRYLRPSWWRKYPAGTRPTMREFRLLLLSQQLAEIRTTRKKRKEVSNNASSSVQS